MKKKGADSSIRRPSPLLFIISSRALSHDCASVRRFTAYAEPLHDIDNDSLVFFCSRCLDNRADRFRDTSLFADYFAHIAISDMKLKNCGSSFFLLIYRHFFRMIHKCFCNHFN